MNTDAADPLLELKLGLGLALVACIGWICATALGFFSRLDIPRSREVKGLDTILGFVLFLSGSSVAYGIIAALSFLPDLWSRALGFAFLAVLLFGYFKAIRAPLRSAIWWGGKPGSLSRLAGDAKAAFLGVLVGYPTAIALNLILRSSLAILTGEEIADQVAVQQVMDSKGDGSLFVVMVVATVAVIPLIEEWLFRGLIQSWLRSFLPAWAAISVASLTFGLMHFSEQQGIANLSLIISLVVFSLVLGFVYEARRSLFASYLLHGIFNGISVGVMILSK